MGVATAVAIGGLAITAATTTNSFVQAGKQKQKQREAEASAQAAMDEARKKLGINFTDEMAVKKEPYELQREALLSAGAQAIEAGVESDRGAAATAGKVMMAQNEAQAGVRTAMGAEMTEIERQQIAEQSRLRDLNVQLDLGEVEGQQQIARDASESRAAQIAQGFQGVSSFAQQGLDLLPLYFKDGRKEVATVREGITEAPISKLNFSNAITAPLMRMPSSQNNLFQPPLPRTGTQYGLFGANYSGVGGN